MSSKRPLHEYFPLVKWEKATASDEECDTLAGGTEPASDPKSVALVAKEPPAQARSGKTVVDRVSDFIRRFVFLPEDDQYLLVAAWTIGTYLYGAVDYVGYLFAYSPERQSGKTTLLEVIDLLVCNSTGLQVSPTEAVMFRMADGHTHLLDEVDSWKDKDDLKSVLNMGYKKSGVVFRCEKNSKGFKPTKFPVFAPRALAGIGLSILPPTTLDRTFAISMVRQKKEEKRERFRMRTIKGEAADLKKSIEHWAKESEGAFSDAYKRGNFSYLDGFSDRTIDISEPLAAIIEVAYAEHPRINGARETLVRAIRSTRKEQHAPTTDHRVLKRLLELASEDDPLIGNATELVADCGNSEENFDELVISQALRRYGFKTKSIRKNGSDPRYRYELSKKSLEEVVKRWVPESESEAEA